MPKSNDHLISPFILTSQEKSLTNTGLTDIALSSFHTRITPVDERILPVLTLETLKKKSVYDTQQQFHQTISSPHKKMASSQSKGGEKRRRKSQSAAAYADTDDTFDDSSFQKKRARAAGGDSFSRKHEGTGTGGGMTGEQGSSMSERTSRASSSIMTTTGGGGVSSSSNITISPGLLQVSLEGVFRVFWELEIAPPAVATPFFGLITRTVSTDYARS
jgi:hypothetical protein